MQKEGRLAYIDIYKGIMIILVVIGHSQAGTASLSQLIYSFHMMAFVAAYGFSYSLASHGERLAAHNGFWRFLAQRARRIMLPYFLWALIYNLPTRENILLILYGSSQSLTKAGGLSSLWYLPCMFVAVVLFELYVYLIGRKLKSEKAGVLGAALFACVMMVAGFALPRLEMGYPWGFLSAFTACGFMGIAWFLGKLAERLRRRDTGSWVYFLAWAASAAVIFLTYRFNLRFITATSHVALSRASYGNPLLFLLDAVSGVICVLSASLLIEKLFANRMQFVRRLFCSLGVNTMGIYLLHKPMVQFFGEFANNHLGGGLKWLPVVVLLALTISFFATKLIRRILPEMIGEEKRKT